MNHLDGDIALLNAAVREAGALALRCFRTDLEVLQKAGDTPDREADIAVDRLLRQRLCGERSEYGWLSEETEDDSERLACERVWVVDPIDGTYVFLKGVRHFCHAAAMVENGSPVASVLFNPVEARFYEGWVHR